MESVVRHLSAVRRMARSNRLLYCCLYTFRESFSGVQSKVDRLLKISHTILSTNVINRQLTADFTATAILSRR